MTTTERVFRRVYVCGCGELAWCFGCDDAPHGPGCDWTPHPERPCSESAEHIPDCPTCGGVVECCDYSDTGHHAWREVDHTRLLEVPWIAHPCRYCDACGEFACWYEEE